MTHHKIAIGILFVAIAAMPIASQTSAAQKPSFGVTSVKPNKSGSGNSRSGIRPNGYFFATNASLKSLIIQAYRVLDFQVSGGPSWIDGDRFDIEARAEPGSIPTLAGPPDPSQPDTMSVMIQSLLEDRFQLKLRKETRDAPVFALVVDPGGARLERSAEGRPGPGGMGPGSIRTSPLAGQPGMEIMGSGVSLVSLAQMIAVQIGRPVIDRTNLTGMFDFSLKVTPQPRTTVAPLAGGQEPPAAFDPAFQPNPSIATALQEQLGLRLDSIRGPVDFLIIDSVQRPSEN
jgi:uncharacterized protein (TIGR03435 family)